MMQNRDLTKYFSSCIFKGMNPEHGEKDVGKKRFDP
jgi:hypothetical protein